MTGNVFFDINLLDSQPFWPRCHWQVAGCGNLDLAEGKRKVKLGDAKVRRNTWLLLLGDSGDWLRGIQQEVIPRVAHHQPHQGHRAVVVKQRWRASEDCDQGKYPQETSLQEVLLQEVLVSGVWLVMFLTSVHCNIKTVHDLHHPCHINDAVILVK